MPRADNSDRLFQILKPEDVSMATNGQPEKFPYKKLNDILLSIQQKAYSLEGRSQPPILRNHLTILAPPIDPQLPEASTDKVALFFNPSTNTFDAAESGATSFSDVINRAGMWETSKDTVVGASAEWATETSSSTPFLWVASTTVLQISEPGTYLIQTKLPLSTTSGGTLTATLTTTLTAFSQTATVMIPGTRFDAPVSHLYVWQKLNDTLDGILVSFTSDDPSAVLSYPATLAILKIK